MTILGEELAKSRTSESKRLASSPDDSALIEAGLSEEDIAARFFVSGQTVRQRLRLASVSPSLLDVYGEDGMSLEQLMAFSVTDNHARQEQVWEQVNQGQHVPAYHIRRLLTEDAIAANQLNATRLVMKDTGHDMPVKFDADVKAWVLKQLAQ